MIVLTVVIDYFLIRYRKKRIPTSVAALFAPPNNVVTIAAANKEQELTFSNLTYKTLNKKDHNILSEYENSMFPADQDNEVTISYDNVQ